MASDASVTIQRSPGGEGGASTSTGFRSFWKKSNKNEQARDATFVEQDPSGKESRLKRLLTGCSGSRSSNGQGGSGTQSEAQKRRQQVYQAQKRHRNRKTEYTRNLEAEIARLRHLDAEVSIEKSTLSDQNKAMRDLLASQSLDAQLDIMDLSSQPAMSTHPSASLNLRYDEQIQQRRWFIDNLESASMQLTSSESSGVGSGQPEHPVYAPVEGDSWAALDFILALEHPCKDHVHHPAIHPSGHLPEPGEAHNHAMTATAAVFACAQGPAASRGHDSQAPDGWQLPHSEIEKLIALSENLPIEETDITPAQAYIAVREAVPNDAYLRPTLETLKQPLAQLVECAHFGSALDTVAFWRHCDAAIESLRFTRPELGGCKGG